MKVLIGITTRNRHSILVNAIESAMQQTYLDKYLEVYDDASDNFPNELYHKYSSVKWIMGNEQKGLLFARNMFLRDASQKLFCSLDDDSWFTSNTALEYAVQIMKNDHRIAAIAFDIKDSKDSEMPIVPIQAVETNMFIGCGHLLRIDHVRAVGQYEQLPGLYGGEEKDLCIRLMDAGYKIILLKGLYIWHDKTWLARDIYFQHRSGILNDLVFTYQRTPLIIMPFIFFIKLWRHYIFSITFKEQRLVKPFLLGTKDFFKHLLNGNIRYKPVRLRTYSKFMYLSKKM
jgi:GT2 family glycosyltransferase